MLRTIIISTTIFTALIMSGCSFGVNEPSAYADNKDQTFANANDPIDSCFVKIKQVSSQRFLDANTNSELDYSAVISSYKNDLTQSWLFVPVANSNNEYTILQASTTIPVFRPVFSFPIPRYLDAYESDEHNYSAVTRTRENDNTQKWRVTPVGNNNNQYRIMQISTNRYLDAHTNNTNDFSVVTSNYEDNDSQIWEIYIIPNR